MELPMQPDQKSPLPIRDTTLGILVSLYLILLGFFAVLNSLSEDRVEKAGAVLDSLNRSFKAAERPGIEMVNLLEGGGEGTAERALISELRQLFPNAVTFAGSFPPGGDTSNKVFPPRVVRTVPSTRKYKYWRDLDSSRMISPLRKLCSSEWFAMSTSTSGASRAKCGWVRRKSSRSSGETRGRSGIGGQRISHDGEALLVDMGFRLFEVLGNRRIVEDRQLRDIALALDRGSHEFFRSGVRLLPAPTV